MPAHDILNACTGCRFSFRSKDADITERLLVFAFVCAFWPPWGGGGVVVQCNGRAVIICEILMQALSSTERHA